MKVLFAVSTEDIAEKIIKEYQRDYKEIVSSKNVYYFNAIIKELQRNQTYDRIVISEDLEPFTNNNYEAIDKFIFEKLDGISDEAIDREGRDIPIVIICSERREKSDNLLVKLFSIGIYDALIGNDRTIENVCNLLNKPRTKKEAKTYYKIEQNEYENENERNVSEVEIQNILSHYRKLGKNEGRYVNSFNSIAEQYNDDQLKIIIKFLPMDVKAVLEAESPKYQSIMTYNTDNIKTEETKKSELNVSKIMDSHSKQPLGPVIIPSAMRKGNEVRKIIDTNLTEQEPEVLGNDTNDILREIENIEGVASIEPIEPIDRRDSIDRRDKDTIDRRSMMDRRNTIDTINQVQNNEPIISSIEEITPIEPFVEPILDEPKIEQPVKRGRGRPRKVVIEPEVTTPKRGRGRPRKNPLPEEQKLEDIDKKELSDFEALVEKSTMDTLNKEETITELPGFEDEDPTLSNYKEEPVSLPGVEKLEELPSLESIEELPSFKERPRQSSIFKQDMKLPEIDEWESSKLPGFDYEERVNNELTNNLNQIKNINSINNTMSNLNDDYDLSSKNNLKQIETEDEEKEIDISYLLSQDKKIVSFVGTSKNGVSFLVNNIAEILSNNGIKTAIVDLTTNKNSYYIYTENREELRKIAYASMENLKQGNPIGIEVNRNLTVYTSSPNIRNTGYSIEKMLETLVKNYSLILLDCDYTTNKEYFRVAQEIYMIQSMDVLTIQPLTEFLRKLKLSNILQPEKLKAVVNKAQRIRGLNEDMIIGGMSTYNDPEMSIQDRLFDMRAINKTVIPFDIEAYAIYLSGIANCEISTRGYNKVFMNCLNKLADQVYPVMPNSTLKRKNKENGNYMNYDQRGTNFSANMNSTLDQMKRQYK